METDIAFGSWPLIVSFYRESCAEEGVYLALIFYPLRGNHHCAFLCPEEHHSDQIYLLIS